MIKIVYISLVIVSNMVDQGRIILQNFGLCNLSIGYNLEKNVFISMKCLSILANSVDPDEMLHNAAFHLDLHCLLKHAFTCSIHL